MVLLPKSTCHLQGPGQEFKWRPIYHKSKYLKCINQANKLLNAICSSLLSQQTFLYENKWKNMCKAKIYLHTQTQAKYQIENYYRVCQNWLARNIWVSNKNTYITNIFIHKISFSYLHFSKITNCVVIINIFT